MEQKSAMHAYVFIKGEKGGKARTSEYHRYCHAINRIIACNPSEYMPLLSHILNTPTIALGLNLTRKQL